MTLPDPLGEAQERDEPDVGDEVGLVEGGGDRRGRHEGSDLASRAPRQRCATATKRLAEARARKLISALVGHPCCAIS
ncbi:hypothetical protein AB0G85_24960 [Streptomyces sioyaensis]|uniref:hypothetical protein n=1 Tax=Streptomyces sioyaensis TaxID=67364 RepID=UPI0033E5CE76